MSTARARHALLAYQTVDWALRTHPRRARELVRDCLREGYRHAGRPAAAPSAADDDSLARYGLVSAGRRAALRRESWTEVVAPILASLLAATHPPGRSRERRLSPARAS